MSRKYIPARTDSSGDDVWMMYTNFTGYKSIEIIEENQLSRDTGLVDQYGNKLICVEVADQIGFIRRTQ